jgi:hypothetical protein
MLEESRESSWELKSPAVKRNLYVYEWQWDCYKSVAGIGLMKTEIISAYVTVNFSVYMSDSAGINCSYQMDVSKSNYPIQNPSVSHEQPEYVTIL